MSRGEKEAILPEVFTASMGGGQKRPAARRISRRSVLVLACAMVFLLVGAQAAWAEVKYTDSPKCRGTTHTAIEVGADIFADHSATWSFVYSTTKGGPWTPIPGGSGALTQAQAEGTGAQKSVKVSLSGLSPEEPYYVLGTITSNGTTITEETSCETVPLHARPEVDNASAVTATSAEVAGTISPNMNRIELHWRFESATSPAGPWSPVAGGSGAISKAETEAEPGGFIEVAAAIGGLSSGTTYYIRLAVEDEPEWPEGSGETVRKEAVSNVSGFETQGPPLASTYLVHSLHGETMRVLGAVTSRGGKTSYGVQYVSQKQFEATGWSEAKETPTAAANAARATDTATGVLSFVPQVVGVDLPTVAAGEYRIRFVARDELGETRGAEQPLTVSSLSEAGGEEACPNQRFRSGLSAHLLECRAYEQVTPTEKEGAIEILKYGASVNGQGAVIGEDGNHLAFTASLTKWGSGQGPYFFERDPEVGWQMTAASPQPETGVDVYGAKVFGPDLTSVGLDAQWHTDPVETSPSIEFKLGPPGGPYSSVSVPRADVPEDGGLVTASEDLSHAILEVDDPELMSGHPTGTVSGADLYEYSNGQLSQVNVFDNGETIGTCGARVARGYAETPLLSARRAISADGSRVFFVASPGNCAHPHLYMRTSAGETVDFGEYEFFDANKPGTLLLAQKCSVTNGSETCELVLLNTLTDQSERLFTLHAPFEHLSMSTGFNVLYMATPEQIAGTDAPLIPRDESQNANIYRYDVLSKSVSFVFQIARIGGVSAPTAGIPSPDGRYDYFEARSVAGVLGGGEALGGLGADEPTVPNVKTVQVYRYDSVGNEIECISCASPADPEPRLGSTMAVPEEFLGVAGETLDSPRVMTASDDGRVAFFATAAALVPQDVDGEVPPQGRESEDVSNDQFTSVSSDVYEWRAAGVAGCAKAQGCISLITPGTGGVQVTLLGTTHSGDDVFFLTHSSLLPRDNDTAADIYDARIGGGFPEAVKPADCEGDACLSPVSAPIDTTPASLSFSGPGNPPIAGQQAAKAKSRRVAKACKAKACKRKRRMLGRRKKNAKRPRAQKKGGRK